MTSTGDDERTRVTFGDGVHSTRLPTGAENVRARYRIGAAGNVAEGRISQLATRPLGVSGVTNPAPATGGADPQRRAAGPPPVRVCPAYAVPAPFPRP